MLLSTGAFFNNMGPLLLEGNNREVFNLKEWCKGQVIWADFNGDDKLDWICNSRTKQCVLISTGETLKDSHNAKQSLSSALPTECLQGQWRDFDGDGRADLMCDSTRDAYVWLSNGQSLEQLNPDNAALRLGTSAKPWCAGAKETRTWTDFNGDGILDFVCSSSDGTHRVLVGKCQLDAAQKNLHDEL